jgi:hypothetical protein
VCCLAPRYSKNRICVFPVLAVVRLPLGACNPLVNPGEVEEVFTSPLGDFLAMDRHTHHDITWDGADVFRVHFFEVDAMGPGSTGTHPDAIAAASAATTAAAPHPPLGLAAAEGAVPAGTAAHGGGAGSAAPSTAPSAGYAAAAAVAAAAAAALAASSSSAGTSGGDLGRRSVFGLTAGVCMEVAMALAAATEEGFTPGYPLAPEGGTFLYYPPMADLLALLGDGSGTGSGTGSGPAASDARITGVALTSSAPPTTVAQAQLVEGAAGGMGISRM